MSNICSSGVIVNNRNDFRPNLWKKAGGA